jgi:hypothetical protein
MDMAAQIRNADKSFNASGPNSLRNYGLRKALGSEYSQFIMNFLSARVIAHFDMPGRRRPTKNLSGPSLCLLSAMKTDKNVPKILDVDGDTCILKALWCAHCQKLYHRGSPTVTPYTQRRNPKGIPKIVPDSTPKMMISIWERYMASWLTISIPTAYSRQLMSR